jgi:hypothetical protein
MAGPFTSETYQSGDGNLNEPITIGRLGQPVRIGGGTEWRNIGSGPIADRPSAADFGVGTWQDSNANISKSDGNVWSDIFEILPKDFTDILVNGDSTSVRNVFDGWWGTTGGGTIAINVTVGDIQQECHADLVASSVGYLNYRAVDSRYQWKAPGDTIYGAWSQILPNTRGRLESSSANKACFIGATGESAVDVSDQPITITTGSPNVTTSDEGIEAILRYFRIDLSKVSKHGVGGTMIATLLQSLPYLNIHHIGNGLDITSFGINDSAVSSDDATAKLEQYKTYINSRLASGRTIIWVGIKGKTSGSGAAYNAWGTTFLTSFNLEFQYRLHGLLLDYAKDNPRKFIYVNTLSDFMDAGYLDFRPKIATDSQVTVDTVHQSALGGQLIAINAVNLAKDVVKSGDDYIDNTLNLLGSTLGVYTGTTAAASTASGQSGVLPTGIIANPGGSIDGTCVYSVIPRSGNIAAYSDIKGEKTFNAIKMLMSNGVAAPLGFYGIKGSAASWTGTLLGIAAGDIIRVGVYIDSLSADIHGISFKWSYVGVTPQNNIYTPNQGGQTNSPGMLAFSDTRLYVSPWFYVSQNFLSSNSFLPDFRVYPKAGATNVALVLGPMFIEKKPV